MSKPETKQSSLSIRDSVVKTASIAGHRGRNHVDPSISSGTSPSVQFVLSPRVLSIPEAARYLSTSPNFIETLMRGEELRFFTYGGKRVVEIAELDRWLDAQKQTTGKLANNILIAQEKDAA